VTLDARKHSDDP
jgi:hypothetical protein